MKVTKKLSYKLNIYLLAFSIVFSALAPSISWAQEVKNTQQDISSAELVQDLPEVSSQETSKDMVNIFDQENAQSEIDNEPEIIDEPDIPAEPTSQVSSDDPVYYPQLDEIRSLLDTLNIEEDSNTGSFIYNYLIEIPSGRNGMQPDLQLTYNNQETNNQNLFGYGWSINIPYIERLNKRGIDKLYTDNYFNSSLTGELVMVDQSNGIYSSKVENGNFLEYTYDDTNNKWTVKDKEGKVYTFGNTAASRQDDPSDSSRVFKWMLEEVRDSNDNFIRYEYYKDNGQIYPYKIFYTGHGSTDGIFEVEFSRESRADNISSFNTGFDVETNYRINEIQVSINNELEKKYNLNYISGNNGIRSILYNIVEGGRDQDTGNLETMPATSFDYNIPEKTWFISDYNYPSNCRGNTESVTIADLNGDSLSDLICFISTGDTDNDDYALYINNGDGTWTEYYNLPSLPISQHEVFLRKSDMQIVDVNGDGLNDFVSDFQQGNFEEQMTGVYLNQGDLTWVKEESYGSYLEVARHLFIDVNGDGRADKLRCWLSSSFTWQVRVYINNGSEFVRDYDYDMEFVLFGDSTDGPGASPIDINTDGIVDFIYQGQVYLNQADGTGWQMDENYDGLEIWHNFAGPGFIQVAKLIDINIDGLTDVVRKDLYNLTNGIFLNNGNGTWTEDNSYSIPVSFSSIYDYLDIYIVNDINGDSFVDWINTQYGDIYLSDNNQKSDSLKQINTQKGAQINIDYQASAQATSTSGLLNPDLPFSVQTVKQITIDDGLGNQEVIEYEYSGGEYYYDNPYDKKFAGFGQVTKTQGDTKTIKYYHQGNDTNSSQGEYNDSYHKIGKAYRQETYDASSDTPLSQNIYKWEEYDQGDGNKFVFNTQKSNTNFVGTTKSTATQYQYSTSTGNMILESNLGEVTVNTGTGAITSTLSGDEKDTDYQYAENSSKHILATPKTRIISDSVDSKRQDIYYNKQAYGQVDKVNITKEDYIEDDVEINRSFNSYGLVYEQSDPKFATTTISYDSYNMYPDSSTDPLSNTSYTDYNLLNGQVATSTDPNGAMTVQKFDAFGRTIEVKISDADNPSTLVLKQQISYQDSTLPRYKEVKNYFDVSSYATSREYYDGLDRVVQTKTQNATSGQYATVDISYDENGRVERQSLPYITTSISYSAPNLSKPAKTYTYDSLDRILTETSPVGTTSYTYNGFKTTITDANNNIKDLTKDAYGNLVEVKEHDGANTYTTSYDYTLTNKLKKITDDEGNIRNFHYDELDNLDWQDMVHTSSATSTPQISYIHDKNGNVLTETSFKGDNISYVYDDLNRVLYEKLDNVNQISYTYDQNGDIGRLSSVIYADGNARYYDYDALGNLRHSTTTIEGESFVMHFDYNLNGDIESITYPNGFVVSYGFNDVGQVDTVYLDQGSGNTTLVENITYNQNGQMTSLERSNGVDTSYTYDADENFRLTDIDTVKPGVPSMTLQNIHYDYDNVGNITQITNDLLSNLAKVAYYDYDDLNRLASSTVSYDLHSQDDYSVNYTYDAIGNMTYNSNLGTMYYVNSNPHQLSNYASTTISYDEAGNTLDNGQVEFFWDHRNRVEKSYASSTEDYTYYEYDHNNQRLLKYTEAYVYVEPHDPIEPGDPITKAYSEGGFIQIATEQGAYWEWRRIREDKYVDGYFEQNKANQNKTHIFLNGSKIATVNHNNEPYFVISDHLGSSSILVDSNGAIAEMTDYLPYGKINYEQINTNLAHDYGFTGREYDEENSLQYYGARYLDNELGRFISIDPLLLELNRNEIYDKLYSEQYAKDSQFNNLLITLGADKGRLTENDIKKASYHYYLSDPQQLNSYSYVTNNPIIGVDLNGETEYHFSFTTNAGIGGEAGTTWTFGVATDGSYGISQTGHAGGLAGADASLGLSLGYSNAESWGQTEGNGYYTGLGGKLGIGLEGNVSWSDEGEYEGFDIGGSIGPSTPIYLHAGVEDTTVVAEGNIKDDLNNTWQSVKQTTRNIFNKINIFNND